MNKDQFEFSLHDWSGDRRNSLTDIVGEACRYGFIGQEIDTVRKWYTNAALEYRSKNTEPDTIEGRLDYAQNVRDYSAAFARSMMAKRIDQWNKRGDQL